ncbi:MAG: magnesium transporter CorA family protein [Candidatus Daviesbacteria bacterium]|nr:magnesium transporter CorA family protein [Candidatus Daviesbacteria bacterium]
MTKTLTGTLKDIQILLGKPRKLAGALKYYLSFLNIKEDGKQEIDSDQKNDKIQSIRNGKILWVDVRNPSRKEISELVQKYPFHPLHLEDCMSKGHFPKIEQNSEDKYLFLLLRFPALNANEESITINQICFFLGKNYLVTVHDSSKDTVSRIFNECKESKEQRKAYIDNSSANLLYTIINQLTDDLTQLLQIILKEVDETEDIVFDDKVSGVYKIGQLRHKILSSRRVIRPLKSLIAEMTTKINKFSSTNLSIYFENIADSIDKAWETLEEARETVDIYKDADFTISSEKTNKTLAVLTILFTFTLPATVIGTFFGMNVLLPGGIEAGSWTFLGKYTTFIIILITGTIPALLMSLYFKKRGWF